MRSVCGRAISGSLKSGDRYMKKQLILLLVNLFPLSVWAYDGAFCNPDGGDPGGVYFGANDIAYVGFNPVSCWSEPVRIFPNENTPSRK
jgi:hypothetical protein